VGPICIACNWHDRAPDPQPHLPALHVAAVEHQADQASGLDDDVASMALDQEIGCSVDVEIGDGSTGHSRVNHCHRVPAASFPVSVRQLQ
jgi:hypothetical protein